MRFLVAADLLGHRLRALRVVVLVVAPLPLVRRRLRVALRRVLPLLLAPERRDVEVAPGASHRLVAAIVDQVGAEDPAVVLAVEGVGAVPLVHAEVLVEVVGGRVPGDLLPPAHALPPALDVGLRRARDERERGVARVQVRRVRDLVGDLRAPWAAGLRPAVHAGLVEEAVDDQLVAPLEDVVQAGRAVWSLEAVLLLDGHPRHPAALGGQRIARAGQPLLLHEQLLARGLPLLGRDDRRHVHGESSSCRYSSTTSNRRVQRARCRSIQSAATLSTSGSSDSRCIRPSTTRLTTPVSSSTRRCLEIAGLDTPNPRVASPTVAGPTARRSTMPRRIGCESALNGSLTIRVTVVTIRKSRHASPMPLVVITGATGGIGRAAAIELGRRGADVAIVGRDPARVKETADAAGGTGHVAGLASLDEVRRLADELLESYARIDVLANNAGAMFTTRRVTPDGYEETFALNHLAPFLLTNLLIERLRQSGARVITTASDAHKGGALDLDDLQGERSFKPIRQYRTSKVRNVPLPPQPGRREASNPATFFPPGGVPPGLGKNDGLLYRLGVSAIAPFSRSPERGARSLVWLALSDEAAALDGVYVQDEKVLAPSAAAQDDMLAAALWEASEELVNRRTH